MGVRSRNGAVHRILGHRLKLLLSLGLLVALGAACDGGGGSIDVTLDEFSVSTSEGSTEAGEVTFNISNEGEETHEFVVIKTDLRATELPTEDDGSVSESGEGMEVVDEVEDLPSGESEELTVDLEAGNYVLICNILEDDESHYQEGMRTPFTVE